MTFLCVLIVSAIGIPRFERSSQLDRQALVAWDSRNYAALLPPRVAQFRLDLQTISSRISLFVGQIAARRIVCGVSRFLFGAWELTLVSSVMQAGLALPMAYYFRRATRIGLPANLVVVPLTQLMMPAADLALALGYGSLGLAKPPVWVTTFALHGITGTIHGLGGLRPADLRVAFPSAVIIMLAIACVALAMLTARLRMMLTAAGLGGVVLMSLWLAAVPPHAQIHPGVLEVTAIDVGKAIRYWW